MKTYNISVEGASHEDSGCPCQDYSISCTFDKGSIAIISDGHGGRTYVRSQVGSKLACEIAKDKTIKFVNDNYVILKDKGQKLMLYTPDNCEVQDSLFAALFADIHNQWYENIQKDSQVNPFTEDEKAKLGAADIKKAYGCTLIVAVKTSDFTFAYHIGDGRLFTILPYVRKWEQPVPWDSRCEDNVTTSLCNNNPISSFRYYLNSSEIQPYAIFLCSDGIEDCYDGLHNSKFSSVKLEVEYSELMCQFLENNEIDDVCTKHLSTASAYGSKDDMSVAFIIDDVYNIRDKWIEITRLYRGAFLIKSEYENIINKIKENENRQTTLRNNISNLKIEIGKIERDLEKCNKELTIIEEKKQDLKSRPAICASFNTMTKELNETINRWHNQYIKEDDTPIVNNKFYDKLKEKVVNAISHIQKEVEEVINQNPQKILDLDNEYTAKKDKREKLNIKKTQYEEDCRRHEDNIRPLSKDAEKLKKQKENKKQDLDSYRKLHLERINVVNNEIKKVLGIDISQTSEDTLDVARSNGKSWNIGKSPEEYIQINEYKNCVQITLNDQLNCSIKYEEYKEISVLLDKMLQDADYSEVDKDCVINMSDEDGLISSFSVDNCAVENIWNMCIAFIKSQK